MPDHFVKLHQVDVIGLQPLQRLVELATVGALLAVDLGHQENLLAVAVPQSLPHPDFALAVVVVPAVVQKLMPVSIGGANDPDALLRGRWMPMWYPPRPISETFSPVRPSVR